MLSTLGIELLTNLGAAKLKPLFELSVVLSIRYCKMYHLLDDDGQLADTKLLCAKSTNALTDDQK